MQSWNTKIFSRSQRKEKRWLLKNKLALQNKGEKSTEPMSFIEGINEVHLKNH